MTVHNIDTINIVPIIEKATMRNSMSTVASSSNQEVLPIEVYSISEDCAPIVKSMTNWVGRQQWIAINKLTIVDISSMSAGGTFIGSSINDDATTIKSKVAGNIEFIS